MWLQTCNVCIFTLSVGNKYRCFFLQEYTTLLTPHRLKSCWKASCHDANHPLQWRHKWKWVKEIAQNWQLMYPLRRFTSWNEHATCQHPFLCCSDILSFLDMADPIVTELTKVEIERMNAYNAYLQQSVLVVAPVIWAICDYPRAAEMVNTLGGTALRFCRMHKVRKYTVKIIKSE